MVRTFLLAALAVGLALLTPPSISDAGVVYEVNSTLDTPDAVINISCDDGAGNCTLRAAIMESNAQPGTQPIHFDIAPGGHQTITPLTPLPEITDPVTIEGSTQDGFSGTPLIELDGSLAGAGSNGLVISAGDSTVNALVINRWGTGGSTGIGIRLNDGGNNVIQGNYLGTDVTGMIAMPNETRGIMVSNSADNTIGGVAASRRNIISGNDERGVMVIGAGATGNEIIGNYIGVNAAGTGALGNGSEGVSIQQAPGNIVGGDQPGEGNVISANEAPGINITAESDNTIVQGNLIGTDVTGTQPLGNANPDFVPLGGPITPTSGIALTGNPGEGPVGTMIGGTTAGARNVISANQGAGIRISNEHIEDTSILGNYIGTQSDGLTPLGNGSHGIEVEEGATDSIIGGPDNGNVIAHNGGDGVRIDGGATLGNRIEANSVYSNAGKGIETINGGNGELPVPVITEFGWVMGAACNGCTVDVYSDADGEGRYYEGQTTADGAGNWTLAGDPVGPNVTATASFSGNTSEFSEPVEIPGESTPTPTPAPTDAPSPTPTETAVPTLIQGDVDCDGGVSPLDGLALVLDDAGFEYNAEPGCPAIGSGDPPFGDVNCDGNVDAQDAGQVLNYVAYLTVDAVEPCVAIGSPL